MSEPLGHISEIFSSIQGEGIYVGERQVFVRFKGCNLSCDYCDTTEDENSKSQAPSSKQISNFKFQDPITVEECVRHINELTKVSDLHHSVSITGGEPLLQVDYLKELLPKIKIKKFLETNGTLFENLSEIIDMLDIIAMDIKLPSATGCDSYMKQHAKFLEAAFMKDVFVKIVFSKDSLPKEIDDAADLIASVHNEIPLVLQPVTPHKSMKNKATAEQCLTFQAIAKRKLKKVLVVPQTHKILGLA